VVSGVPFRNPAVREYVPGSRRILYRADYGQGQVPAFSNPSQRPAGLKLFAVGEGLNEFPSPAHMWSSAITIRREIVDTIGSFRPGVRTFEDIDMWLRIACVYPIALSSAPRAIWHWTAGNRSSSMVPNEEDILKTSLNELREKGLVA